MMKMMLAIMHYADVFVFVYDYTYSLYILFHKVFPRNLETMFFIMQYKIDVA